MENDMNTANIVVTLVVGVVTAVITYIVAKMNTPKKVLGWDMEISTLASDLIALKGDKKLEISFDGELLVNPYLMMVELHNLGNIDIENIEVFIKNKTNASYVIPGFIYDIPDGYEDYWELVREDAEECKIKIKLLKKGVGLKAAFLLDDHPGEMSVYCVSPGLEFKKMRRLDVVIEPTLIQVLKAVLRV